MKTTNQQLKDIISGIDNTRMFSVTFVKKNGEVREMNCMLGVKKHLRGGEQSYDPAEHNLLTVYDLVAKDYRNINFSQLIKAKIDGVEYEVDHV